MTHAMNDSHTQTGARNGVVSGDWLAWKRCAISLARALRTTPYAECGELNHSGGHYHKGNEVCPVCEKNKKALADFEALIANNQTRNAPQSGE